MSDAPCYRCPHPEEHPIVQPLCVCACPETVTEGGMPLLDPTGGPGWRLVSSRGVSTARSELHTAAATAEGQRVTSDSWPAVEPAS